MLTPIAGKRRNEKLPKLGSIVCVQIHPLQYGHRWRRYIVVSYPILDRRGNRVTHLVTLRALDNNDTSTVSGFYCEEIY